MAPTAATAPDWPALHRTFEKAASDVASVASDLAVSFSIDRVEGEFRDAHRTAVVMASNLREALQILVDVTACEARA